MKVLFDAEVPRSLRNDTCERGLVSRFLSYGFLDSRREDFHLSKAYEHKVDVINVITAPEIEMLIIHNEKAYDRFKNREKKPSEFCKQTFICMM